MKRGTHHHLHRTRNGPGSKSGFATKESALNWAEEQEAEVRARTWIAPEDREVATPAQVLRAAMRLQHTFGRAGFVLCLLNAYTGARWSELVALEPHAYDEVNRAIPVRSPLRETAGRLAKAKRPKTPAGKGWIQLLGFLDALYVDLLAEAESGGSVFSGARGGQLRRGNFRTRFWRSAWDGDSKSDQAWLRAPILPGFTFHEGRHTPRTWPAEDGVPEVARAARLGHRMWGRGNVYEHVTPAMKEQVRTVLDARWRRSLQALRPTEREWIVETVPRLGEYHRAPGEEEAS